MQNNFTVTEEDFGQRLDKFLAAQTGLSRSYIQKLITNPNRKVKAGEIIELEIPESKPLDLTPWEFALDVVYEDDNMIVINKPAGLTVHPAAGNWENTLVHALLAHCKGRLSGINGVERPGIVHRLDKDTTGLMVVAKTDAAHKALSAQIESRELKREYMAVVCGVPNPSARVIKTGYGRHPTDRKKMTTFDLTENVWMKGGSSRRADFNDKGEISVGHKTEFGIERGEGKNAKIAVTEYKVVRVLGEGRASLVECKLQTGRTHQIRVHMKHIGHPIIGDQVYGSRRMEKSIFTHTTSPTAHPALDAGSHEENPDLVRGVQWTNTRQALHAFRLTIEDVGGSGRLELEAPVAGDINGLLSSINEAF